MAAALSTAPHALQKRRSPSISHSKHIQCQHLSLARTATAAYSRRTDRRPETQHFGTSNWSFEERMQEALNVLELMEAQGMEPEASLFCILLKSCADAENFEFGKTIHNKIVGTQLENDVFVVNNLINLYSKCRSLKTARRLFDKMPIRNAVSWTSIISMYSQSGFPEEALKMYSLMISDGNIKPNAFTYTVALSSCAKTGNLGMGIGIHEDIMRGGCESDEFIVTALIDMYSKCGRIKYARRVFDKIAEPTVAACTAMIEGYNMNNHAKDAMGLTRKILNSGFDLSVVQELGLTSIIRACVLEMALRQGQEVHAHMIKFGHKPGTQIISDLVVMYEKCDKMVFARPLFNELQVKSLELWGRMISGYVRNGLNQEALELYVDMVTEDVELNPFFLSWALKASVGTMGLKEGKGIHGRVIKAGCGLSEDSVMASLVKLYSDCGCVDEVEKMVRCHRDQI
ncbi:pentatricopeptide repeat-containing protein At1g11290, chloroplastic-like [Macadamia integrifolia]|uniref:pentatricopeptide repeat-containing protein At1g11290, chloroplastic-like n=1 Tax=Macadamia integrifolia TaxID=60698 RepID=UPI001C52FF19|nr:pentatricopeptide repeat-containing protein At1g11290, chloroplastic-like [Macadamia integrifolia]